MDPLYVSFAVALCIGLMIGTERERRKGEGPTRAIAGLRTFAIASLTGAAAMAAGGYAVLAVTILAVAGVTLVASRVGAEQDPGVTTELALILTVLLGGMTIEHAALAAGVAVSAAILLAARSWLHQFATLVLTEAELRDGLVLAASTFVVLPVLPDQPLDPFGALNPRNIWTVVVLVMAISAAGYVAVRALGPKLGLPLAGLASGFISSTATIGAMGARAKQSPEALGSASAGAMLSTLATVIQLAIVLYVADQRVLQRLGPALGLAGVAALSYAALFSFGLMMTSTSVPDQPGRAFSLRAALLFACILTIVLLVAGTLEKFFGEVGVVAAAAAGGLVDTHAPAIAVASLVSAGKLSPEEAALPVMVAFSTNVASKMVLAFASGGAKFAARVVPGLLIVTAFALIGAWML